MHDPTTPQTLNRQSVSPVLKEDMNADPIEHDVFRCSLGEFMPGSYNVSVYLGNDMRSGGDLDSEVYIAGLAHGHETEPNLYSKDAHGVPYMVQYYPRVDLVFPSAGSVAGGTEITLTGGGFAMEEGDVSVKVGGRKCAVIRSSVEEIVCTTPARAPNVTRALPTAATTPVTGADIWLQPIEVVGNWSVVDSQTAHGGAYYSWKRADESTVDASEEFCAFGILSGSTCCAASCGSCGGPDCSQRMGGEANCCDVAISEQGRVCETPESVGCIMPAYHSHPDLEPNGWVTFSTDNGGGSKTSAPSMNMSGVFQVLLHQPALENAACPLSKNVSVVIRSGEGYSVKVVDMVAGKTHDNDEAVVGDPRLISLGSVTLVEGATVLVTVDTSGVGQSCVAVGSVELRFQEPITAGCTDREAANFNADVAQDDGSCLYLGGRGLTTASWSSMSGPFKLDDWYPKEEWETFALPGEFCTVPDNISPQSVEDCWEDNCDLHQQCPPSSFCCLSSNLAGCKTSVGMTGVDSDGWKLIFQHDRTEGGKWPSTLWHSEEDATFSLLDDLERYRRNSDGRFEFKACWPGSGFTECQHWSQLMNPTLNKEDQNMHAQCINCPYTTDVDPDGGKDFRGLLYDGVNSLVKAHAGGNFMLFGSFNDKISGKFRGPQLLNDANIEEYTSEVQLFVRPSPEGEACISCRACYNEDGEVRMSIFHPSGGEPSFEAPACPAYCLSDNASKPRAITLQATHQLVIATGGLSEQPCLEVTSYDSVEDSYFNRTVCEGKETLKRDSVPESMENGRLGGVRTEAFFVAPVTANYSFNTRYNDGGELWLSSNADKKGAQRIFSQRGALEDSTCLSRYVFLQVVPGGKISLDEVQVFKKDGMEVCIAGASMSSNLTDHPAAHCIDKHTSTYCQTAANQAGDVWLELDLGEPVQVGKVVIDNHNSPNSNLVGGSVSYHSEPFGNGDVCFSSNFTEAASEYTVGAIEVSDTCKVGDDWTCTGDKCFQWFGLTECYKAGYSYCSWRYRSLPEVMTWPEAQSHCESLGGTLANPATASENAAVVEASAADQSPYKIWIGLNDRNQGTTNPFLDERMESSDWVFSNGTNNGRPHLCSWYQNWKAGEPSNTISTVTHYYGTEYQSENCVTLDPTDGKWNDATCAPIKIYSSSNGWSTSYANSMRNHVCEIPKQNACGFNPKDFLMQSTSKVPMQEGEVRYLEQLVYNDRGKAEALLTLNVYPEDSNNEGMFTTSTMLGLGAEFLREVRTSSPAVEVNVRTC
jgi:hypothetical protein